MLCAVIKVEVRNWWVWWKVYVICDICALLGRVGFAGRVKGRKLFACSKITLHVIFSADGSKVYPKIALI